MDRLFSLFDHGLQGPACLALGVSVLWGMASVVLSPCHLATIPLIVGFVGGERAFGSRISALSLAGAFAFGMLIAIGLAGGAVIGLGFALAKYASLFSYIIAGIFVLAGLHLVGLVEMPMQGLRFAGVKQRGLLAALGIGLVFGIGLSPCTFAFIAPIIGVAMGTATATPGFGYALLLAFGLGHCGVIAFAGSSTELVQRYMDWNERSRGLVVMKAVCGVLLFLGASALIYAA